MMKQKFAIFFAIIALNAAAFPFGTKVKINGEKIKLEDGIYAKFNTTLGDILIELNTEKAPMTAANFIMLAEGTMPDVDEKYKGKPFFNGLQFHRVIPNFMIQGGDPKGNGQGGPGYEFPNETDSALTHKKGVISMANAGPHTNGSQFFITVAETKQLDGGYSVFGEVLYGQEVADLISKVDRDGRDKPKTPVIMETVEIIRVGKTNKKWDAFAAFVAGKQAFEAEQEAAEAARMAAEEEARLRAEQEREALKLKYPTAVTSSTGLMYIVEEKGDGPKPEDGTLVNVHYAGYLTDGSLFDSSIKEVAEANNKYNPQREPYAPMQVPYGPSAQLIPGFKEGVSLLNVGGKAKIIIPPNLGYGTRGAGGIIPPNAWLIFDIQLIDIAPVKESK